MKLLPRKVNKQSVSGLRTVFTVTGLAITIAVIATFMAALHAAKGDITVLVTVYAVCGIVIAFFLVRASRQIRRLVVDQYVTALELQRQREILSVTLASIGDAVILTDTTAKITFMNPVAEQLTGWKAPDAIDQPCSNVFRIIHESTRQPIESPVEKVLRDGPVVGLTNHTLLVRKDGTELPIDESGAPIREPDGAIRGVVLVFRDFSEHKKTQLALEEANRLLAERPHTPRASAPEPAATAPEKKRSLDILLLEDHEDTALVVGSLLRHLGHIVTTSSHISDALAHTREHRFDLILSDLGLPDGSGVDFIRELRRTSQTPAIALTGYGNDEAVARCIEAGFNKHLTKPVDFQELDAVLRETAA